MKWAFATLTVGHLTTWRLDAKGKIILISLFKGIVECVKNAHVQCAFLLEMSMKPPDYCLLEAETQYTVPALCPFLRPYTQ